MSALSSNVKIVLPPVPVPFSGTTAWAALTPLVNVINNNFNVIANGAGFIPGTVRLINGRPVNLSTGDLPLLLSDIPDAAGNTYVRNNFATVTALNNLNNNINANLAAANAAVQTLRNTVNTIQVGNVVTGNTAQVSAWIQANVAAVNSAWTANAATQQTAINTVAANLGAFATYSNVYIGSIYTSLSTLQGNAAAQASDINVLYANAAAQSSAIGTLNANLGSYQTTVNANLGAATTNINNLQSQVSTLDDQRISINSTVGSLLTQVSLLTSSVNTTNTNWTSNVAQLKSNAATLASQINTVNATVTSLRNDITVSRTVHVERRVPTASDGSLGDIWYQTY